MRHVSVWNNPDRPMVIRLKFKYEQIELEERMKKNEWNLKRIQDAKDRCRQLRLQESKKRAMEKDNQYKREHREQYNAYFREYYKNNSEKIKKRQNKYYQANKEEILTKQMDYYWSKKGKK